MKKLMVLGLAIVAFAAVAATSAEAASPHFLRATSSVDSQGNLLCGFKEAGLGDVATTTVTCTADVTAVFACINGGGNHPQAANKETISTMVEGTVDVPVRNGQTTGTVIVGPPSPGDFSCPNGQRLVLASVSYTNVTLHGVNGDTASAPDASRTFLNV
jgi:hypothetical protein